MEEDTVQKQSHNDKDVSFANYPESLDSSDGGFSNADIGDESPEDLERLAAWIGETNEDGLTAWIPKSSMSTIHLY